MSIVLGANQYGKAEVRVVKVTEASLNGFRRARLRTGSGKTPTGS